MKTSTQRIIALGALICLQYFMISRWISSEKETRDKGQLYKIPLQNNEMNIYSKSNYIYFKPKPSHIEFSDSGRYVQGERIYICFSCNASSDCIYESITKVTDKPCNGLFLNGKIEAVYPLYKNEHEIEKYQALISYGNNRLYLSEKIMTRLQEKYAATIADSSTTAYVSMYVFNGKYAVDNIWINGEAVK